MQAKPSSVCLATRCCLTTLPNLRVFWGDCFSHAHQHRNTTRIRYFRLSTVCGCWLTLQDKTLTVQHKAPIRSHQLSLVILGSLHMVDRSTQRHISQSQHGSDYGSDMLSLYWVSQQFPLRLILPTKSWAFNKRRYRLLAYCDPLYQRHGGSC